MKTKIDHGAPRYSFRFKDGQIPVGTKGAPAWVRDRQEAIRQGKSWGASKLVKMVPHPTENRRWIIDEETSLDDESAKPLR